MIETKNYNTTDLNPLSSFERHVFHRDQFAHYLRWTHILKEARIGETIVDFGCGNGNLLEVLYRNKFRCEKYIGLDIRQKTIDIANKKFEPVDRKEFIAIDLIKGDETIFSNLKGDKVCSFEVLEHVGKSNGIQFMKNFMNCGKEDATYYLSTPNYDEHVGAAGNHIYDSGDGRGVQPQEYNHAELQKLIIDSGFIIIEKFGTFASQRDYKPMMNEWQKEMFNGLTKYYDSNLVANLMAPFFPEQSRNCLWVLKRLK